MNPFSERRQLCEWNDRDPLLFIFSMQDDGHIVRACVKRCLFHRCVQIQPLRAFHFEMHTRQIRDDVFAFQPRELLPASSSNSQSFGDRFRGFEFAAFAFIA